MKERPIPYSIPMVIARREGRKTQTRRGVVPQPSADVTGFWYATYPESKRWTGAYCKGNMVDTWVKCPYGQPGDRLWNREPWKTEARFDHLKPSELPADARIWYLADGPAPEGFGRYRHARFMPRRFSRGLDEIVSVRVERLQDISEDDVIREGVKNDSGWDIRFFHVDGQFGTHWPAVTYSLLWESINGQGSFDLNPWVWVVEFRVIELARAA